MNSKIKINVNFNIIWANLKVETIHWTFKIQKKKDSQNGI